MPAVKCKGCDKDAKTKKGWCSIDCYRHNQYLGENKSWFKKGHTFTIEVLTKIGIKSKEWHKNNPEKSKELIKQINTIDANLKKSHKGINHPLWIDDRTKIKSRRCYYEEKLFFKEILKERNYKCELTKETSNKLSVHHMDSVHLFPEKQFDKNNVIVIKKDIHMDFHKKYGFQWATKEKWENYIKENNYNYAV
jgi:hypothetical protein